MYIKTGETAGKAKPNARETDEMARDNGERQKNLEGLWKRTRVEGSDTSSEMFPKRYGIQITRRAPMRIDSRNKFLNSIEPKQEYDIRAASFPGFDRQVTKVHITEEIYYRTESNSEPCENTICKASITLLGDTRPSMEVTMKFRKEKMDTVTLTENEMRKAALIQDSPVVRAMFPSVYFVCVWSWTDGGRREYWEGVAMESLNPVTREMRERSAFNCEAASILRQMHREGFIHGDGHSGNFMIRPELPHHTRAAAAGGASGAASGAQVSLRLVPIDFDMIQALPEPYGSDTEKYQMVEDGPVPQDDKVRFIAYLNRLATKVMIIYDYNKLMFSNNLQMPFMDQREKNATMCQLIDQYLMYQCHENDRQQLLGPSILFMPWPFAFNWEKDYHWDPAYLHANLQQHAPRLLEHIDRLSIAEIDIFYLRFFQRSRPGQNSLIKELNKTIEESFNKWRGQQPP